MQGKGKLIAGVVFAVAIAFVLIGALVPIGLNQMNETVDETVTLVEGEHNDVNGKLTNAYVNATDIDSTSGYVKMDIVDTENNKTHTVNLTTGSSTTLETDLGDIDITVESIASDTEADVTFEFDSTFGWSSGTQSVWTVIPVMGVLVLLAVLGGWAYKSFA